MGWVEATRAKARLIHEQIGSMESYARAAGLDDEEISRTLEPHYEMLTEIYEREMPRAIAEDKSDLVFRLRGPAVDGQEPSLSLLTDLFDKVKKSVKRVARAVADSSERGATEMDLTLTALGPGSLIVGFSVPDSETLLLGEDDPLLYATREALKALGTVTRDLADGVSIEQLELDIPDPAVRDAALLAAQELAPSGRSNITSIEVSGRSLPDRPKAAALTTGSRKLARDIRRITAPRQALETQEQYEGTVREIDLDLRRFYLRRIGRPSVEEVRCKYDERFTEVAPSWTNRRVMVKGVVEFDPEGRARLLTVSSVSFVG